MVRMRVFVVSLLAVAVLIVSSNSQAKAATPDQSNRAGAVYSLTNAVAGNAVAIFNRAADGSLTPAGTVATTGLGTGKGLGSQGALVLSENGRRLFAVNAGSDSISALRVTPTGLVETDTVASGGTTPISLTVHDNTLYVLNAGSENIVGFKVSHDGHLTQIANATLPLSGTGVGPAEVAFSPNGKLLAVTEKTTNKIDTYTVDNKGVAHGPNVQSAAGQTPFGFSFDGNNRLIVSEAFGGAANLSAVSSYSVAKDGTLTAVSPSSPTHLTAACWIAVSPNGHYTYTTDAGSSEISGYTVAKNGTLNLLNSDGMTASTGAGSHPTDEAFSTNGRYLYALNGSIGTIAAYSVKADGSLTALTGASGLTLNSAGLAAR